MESDNCQKKTPVLSNGMDPLSRLNWLHYDCKSTIQYRGKPWSMHSPQGMINRRQSYCLKLINGSAATMFHANECMHSDRTMPHRACNGQEGHRGLICAAAGRPTSPLHGCNSIQQHISQWRLLEYSRPIQFHRSSIFFKSWCDIQNEVSLGQ